MKLTIELTDQEYESVLAFARLFKQRRSATFAGINHYRVVRALAVSALTGAALDAIRQAHYSEMTKEFSHD